MLSVRVLLPIPMVLASGVLLLAVLILWPLADIGHIALVILVSNMNTHILHFLLIIILLFIGAYVMSTPAGQGK